MKVYALLSFFLFGICTNTFSQNSDYIAQAKAFQDSLNAFESNPETTNIIAEDFADFEGLHFFPIDLKYRVMAKFVAVHDTHVFKLTYSNDPNVPHFVSSGTLFFTIDGVEYSIHTFQNVEWLNDPEYSRHVFIPFNDWTNGPESYGGGRFIDALLPEEGDKMVIDFNCCYNPPCCYNYNMACPLIPEDNHIGREIRAGVLAY